MKLFYWGCFMTNRKIFGSVKCHFNILVLRPMLQSAIDNGTGIPQLILDEKKAEIVKRDEQEAELKRKVEEAKAREKVKKEAIAVPTNNPPKQKPGETIELDSSEDEIKEVPVSKNENPPPDVDRYGNPRQKPRPRTPSPTLEEIKPTQNTKTLIFQPRNVKVLDFGSEAEKEKRRIQREQREAERIEKEKLKRKEKARQLLQEEAERQERDKRRKEEWAKMEAEKKKKEEEEREEKRKRKEAREARRKAEREEEERKYQEEKRRRREKREEEERKYQEEKKKRREEKEAQRKAEKEAEERRYAILLKT